MSEETKIGSKNGDQWISALIYEAKCSNPSVADCVFTSMESLLRGPISEAGLTPMRLKAMANQLIEDVVPNPSQPEEKQ